jgi:hypothetical protein
MKTCFPVMLGGGIFCVIWIGKVLARRILVSWDEKTECNEIINNKLASVVFFCFWLTCKTPALNVYRYLLCLSIQANCQSIWEYLIKAALLINIYKAMSCKWWLDGEWVRHMSFLWIANVMNFFMTSGWTLIAVSSLRQTLQTCFNMLCRSSCSPPDIFLLGGKPHFWLTCLCNHMASVVHHRLLAGHVL